MPTKYKVFRGRFSFAGPPAGRAFAKLRKVRAGGPVSRPAPTPSGPVPVGSGTPYIGRADGENEGGHPVFGAPGGMRPYDRTSPALPLPPPGRSAIPLPPGAGKAGQEGRHA
jgi:hypothetical protein